MEFKNMAPKCKWRVVSRELSTCKVCLNQPNGQLCKKSNCMPYQFAKTMTNEIREEVKHIIEDSNKTMTGYANKTLKYDFNKAFYMIAGSNGGNRIKLFGLTDISNSREFFGIKAVFHDITLNTYKQGDSIYTIGVVNTLYNLKFNPERVSYLKQLKNKLDPEDRINSYRLVKAKMRWNRFLILFYIAKKLYKP